MVRAQTPSALFAAFTGADGHSGAGLDSAALFESLPLVLCGVALGSGLRLATTVPVVRACDRCSCVGALDAAVLSV